MAALYRVNGGNQQVRVLLNNHFPDVRKMVGNSNNDAGQSISKEFVVAVPFQMLLGRPMNGIGWRGDPFVFHPAQECAVPCFAEVPLCHEDRIVIPNGPEAGPQLDSGVYSPRRLSDLE